jgi:hypothetical protein
MSISSSSSSLSLLVSFPLGYRAKWSLVYLLLPVMILGPDGHLLSSFQIFMHVAFCLAVYDVDCGKPLPWHIKERIYIVCGFLKYFKYHKSVCINKNLFGGIVLLPPLLSCLFHKLCWYSKYIKSAHTIYIFLKHIVGHILTRLVLE